MKKILALSMVLALSTSITLAATSYTSALKNAIKQDIESSKQEAKGYTSSVKEAIKKDLEEKQKANLSASEAKKAEKIAQFQTKIDKLNKEKAEIQDSKDMTNTEKIFKTKALDKQIEFYTKQMNALK